MRTVITTKLGLFFSVNIIILILCFTVKSKAQVQQVKFNLLKGVEGVSIGKINSITQDPQGYIWLSDQTNGCITRYDGYRMTSFKTEVFNSNSLGGIYPECIFADPTGIIWIGFYGMGLDRFDP